MNLRGGRTKRRERGERHPRRTGGRLRAACWLALLPALLAIQAFAGVHPDRWVWIFGWGLDHDRGVTNITRVLNTAAQHNINGAVVSFGLDTLCKQDADYHGDSGFAGDSLHG